MGIGVFVVLAAAMWASGSRTALIATALGAIGLTVALSHRGWKAKLVPVSALVGAAALIVAFSFASRNIEDEGSPLKRGLDALTSAPSFTMIAEPATVEVTGPESAVKQVTEALTEPVSIAGATADVAETVTVGTLDPALRVKAPRTATVRVQVTAGARERTVRNRPVRLRDLPPNLTAQAIPPDVEVVIYGSREGVAAVDPDQVVPFVDLKGLGAGEYSLNVHVDPFPAGVARVEPPTVQVRLSSVRP